MTSPGLIEIEASDTPESAAAKITFQPDVILLLLGSTADALGAQVRSLCGRALAPIALVTNALIVDDGLSQGLAAHMGTASQQLDQSPLLLGILPSGGEPEPNHTAVLRLPPEWSDAARQTFLILAAKAKSHPNGETPVVAILFGGGAAEQPTILRCARRGWPMMMVQGSGGLADAILVAQNPPADGSAQPVTDPDLQEIIDTGNICPLPLNGEVDDLKRVLLGPIQQPGDILSDAWARYDDLDQAAVHKQGLFQYTQVAILALAVLATLLAIGITGAINFGRFTVSAGKTLHILLILVPIVTSILVAFNSRFREGNKWLLLRGSAESIKREIFRYRTRSGSYAEEQCTKISAQSKLAAAIKDITAALLQSEVNRSSVPSRVVSDPKRLTFLKPEDYLTARIADQAGFFLKKTIQMYRRLKRAQVMILLAGGLGTFLAAISFGVWVALTTALATAVAAKLEIDQVENSLVQYNVALTNLRNIESWWRALSPWEKTRRKNIDLLVDQTEQTLERETSGWMQQMQSTLEKLTERESDSDAQQDPASKN